MRGKFPMRVKVRMTPARRLMLKLVKKVIG
jgi:hypothetical protein